MVLILFLREGIFKIILIGTAAAIFSGTAVRVKPWVKPVAYAGLCRYSRKTPFEEVPMNTLDSVSRSQDMLFRMLETAAVQPQELADKLIAINAQNIIDLNKTESMGQLVDMYV